MKSTGVVRRIDDLGRIVIPKEIRRNLKIRDGESMEVFIDLDSIILKKYSKLEDINLLARKICIKINELTGYNVILTDREKIIVSIGKDIQNFSNKLLSDSITSIIDNRQVIKDYEPIDLYITSEFKLSGYFYITPVIIEADSLGVIIIYSQEKMDNTASISAQLLSYFICQNIDIN